MSKSGLFAHFGSKEELQLATIEAAEDVFRTEVLDPSLAEPEGLPRLRALCERFLDHVEQGVFPGGCFFASAAAELDTRPGPLRDRIAEVYDGWVALLEGSVLRAQELGQLDRVAGPGAARVRGQRHARRGERRLPAARGPAGLRDGAPGHRSAAGVVRPSMRPMVA